MTLAENLLRQCWSALDWPTDLPRSDVFTGTGSLPSAFPVTDFASASVATAASSVAALIAQLGGNTPPVSVDRRLCSFWFHTSIRPIGWALAPLWDPIAGDYACSDGWIRLHTNAPLHRQAAETVLGARQDKAAMARAVAPWQKSALESAIVAAGGCAAEMRTEDAWSAHPQGRAVLAEPLIHQTASAAPAVPARPFDASRPLRGLRVLDLTRVLAGPVASRFLAGFGADVLRIDPPVWDEPGVVPEVNVGKRTARLDLRASADRMIFSDLLGRAEVLLHGYRPGALEGLGFGDSERSKLAPGLIDVGLNAYGWSEPWAARRGFDSLVQMSAGIAETGMRWRGVGQPFPLPVQALDHATGYLMAAAAVRGIARRFADGSVLKARLSLARTARLLAESPRIEEAIPLAPETPDDLATEVERTHWGPARRLRSPLAIAGAPLNWSVPAGLLGGDAASWAERPG